MANINVPFAIDGIKRQIPETSAHGLVNWRQGFTNLYSLPVRDGGKQIQLPDFNQLHFDITSDIIENRENIAQHTQDITRLNNHLTNIENNGVKFFAGTLNWTVGNGGTFNNFQAAMDATQRYKNSGNRLMININLLPDYRLEDRHWEFIGYDLRNVSIFGAREYVVNSSVLVNAFGFNYWFRFGNCIMPYIKISCRYEEGVRKSNQRQSNYDLAFLFFNNTFFYRHEYIIKNFPNGIFVHGNYFGAVCNVSNCTQQGFIANTALCLLTGSIWTNNNIDISISNGSYVYQYGGTCDNTNSGIIAKVTESNLFFYNTSITKRTGQAFSMIGAATIGLINSAVLGGATLPIPVNTLNAKGIIYSI